LIEVGPVTGPDEIDQILALQRANLEHGRPADEVARDGFVTVQHTAEILGAMHAIEPSIVARDDGRVVGYALVMPLATRALVPVLGPMFDKLDELPALAGLRYYVMGQICVAASHRGRGVVEAMYAGHRARLAGRFDVVVTEIAMRNVRSMRAHEKVGFEAIHRYRDETDDWAIVAWRF
jgi:L-amino acid N-acyltransferase YncA